MDNLTMAGAPKEVNSKKTVTKQTLLLKCKDILESLDDWMRFGDSENAYLEVRELQSLIERMD